jgi:ornithine cyclodeaminase/alanine dehydrogenase-like protein (mu-crystallin family)
MPGYLPDQDVCGLKWVGVFGHNKLKYGVPSLSSLMILNDVETGYPIAVMEAGLITAIRTANAFAVSAKYLARKDSRVLGIVGSGEQGRFALKAICHVVPTIEEVKLYDLVPGFARKVADELGSEAGVQIFVCNSAEEVIRDSDIVATSAPLTASEPVYPIEWLKEGTLVLPIHCNGWPLELLEQNKFIVDDWAQYHSYMFGPSKYYKQELTGFYAQLGEIVSGRKPGRESNQEIIFSANLGIALQDISLGKEVLRAAKEKGLGKTLSLY